VRVALLRVLCLSALLTVPTTAFAQFGHPLKGEWSGQWGPADNLTRLLLTFDWDGKDIVGTINPGPNAATVKKATFDYTNPSAWKVQLEAEGKDASGKPVQIRVDGVLENIGAYYRVFHGTWTEGSRKGNFTVTRN
jgi:hypothetical protein